MANIRPDRDSNLVPRHNYGHRLVFAWLARGHCKLPLLFAQDAVKYFIRPSAFIMFIMCITCASRHIHNLVRSMSPHVVTET